jgi:hypothetical protein
MRCNRRYESSSPVTDNCRPDIRRTTSPFRRAAGRPVEGLIAVSGQHLAGGLFGQRIQAKLLHLVRQVPSALRRLREKFFSSRGIVAQPAAELLEQVGHLFFGRGQVLQGQLVFAAQLARRL